MAKLDDEGKVIVHPTLGTHILTNSWTIWFMNRGPGVKISNYLDATKELESFSSVEEFWQIYAHLKRVDRLPFTSEYQIFRKGVKPMWEDPVNVSGGKWVFRFKRPFKTYSNTTGANSFFNTSAANSANNSLTSTPTTSHALLATSFTNSNNLHLNHNSASTDGTTTPTVASPHHFNNNANNKPTPNYARSQSRLYWEKLLLSMIGGSLAESSNVDSNEITGIVVSVRKDEDILSVWTRSGEHGEGNPEIRESIRKLLDLPEAQIFEFKNHSESIKEGAQKQALYNNSILSRSQSSTSISSTAATYGGSTTTLNGSLLSGNGHSNSTTSLNSFGSVNNTFPQHLHSSPAPNSNTYWGPTPQQSGLLSPSISSTNLTSPSLLQHSSSATSLTTVPNYNHHARHNFDTSNSILRASSPSPSPYSTRFGAPSSLRSSTTASSIGTTGTTNTTKNSIW